MKPFLLRHWILTLMLAVVAAGSLAAPVEPDARYATATFAGGCFWCMQPPFDKLNGVISTTAGYTGGHKDNPTYKEVCSGMTGHNEVVFVVFDPKVVSYESLLKVFWESHNPTQGMRQGNDVGTQYRSGIYVYSDEQRKLAQG